MKKYKVSIYCVAEYEVEADSPEEAIEHYEEGNFLGESISDDKELHYAEKIK